MTPLFPAQRAAEEFDQALRGTPTAAVDDRYTQLLATVERLRLQPELTPRPEFVAELRERLMAAAETELVGAPAQVHQPAPRHSTRRRLGALAASLVIVGGSAGVAVAASGALPGEQLYPVKRGIEQVQAAVHLDPAARGVAQLDQAGTRLDEVRALAARAADPTLIDETMESFREAADSGSEKLFAAYQIDGDVSHVEDVRQFTTGHLGEIADLSSAADPRSSDAFIDAADTVADIDEQARSLCTSCKPQAPVAMPAGLAASAGGPSAEVLLSRPVTQAQADITLAQAQLQDSIAKLQAAVEKEAGKVPTAQQLAQAAAAARAQRDALPDTPVSSTIAPDGGLLPTVATGAGTAVTHLVTGLTGTLTTVVDLLPKTGTPLDETVEDLTKGLDEGLGKGLGKNLETPGDEPGR